MKKMTTVLGVIGLTSCLTACNTVTQIAQDLNLDSQILSLEPSSGEINSGLKAALTKGAQFAVDSLSADGGYFNDPVSKIVFPEEASFAVDTLKQYGLGSLVDKFEERLNQGAEQGAKRAFPIFSQAVQNMTIQDVNGVLFGGETAATEYFKRTTREQLTAAFQPEIKASLDQVNASQYWQEITQAYNSIPFTEKKINTDLVNYTTQRAIDGMFLKIAEEESKIRDNPVERTTDILQKVFGYADTKKGQ